MITRKLKYVKGNWYFEENGELVPIDFEREVEKYNQKLRKAGGKV